MNKSNAPASNVNDLEFLRIVCYAVSTILPVRNTCDSLKYRIETILVEKHLHSPVFSCSVFTETVRAPCKTQLLPFDSYLLGAKTSRLPGPWVPWRCQKPVLTLLPWWPSPCLTSQLDLGCCKPNSSVLLSTGKMHIAERDGAVLN